DIDALADRFTRICTATDAEFDAMSTASLDGVAKHDIDHTLDTCESIYDDVIAAATDSSAARASHRPAAREQDCGRALLRPGRSRRSGQAPHRAHLGHLRVDLR